MLVLRPTSVMDLPENETHYSLYSELEIAENHPEIHIITKAALKDRICSVIQVLFFIIAIIGVINFLFIDYNEKIVEKRTKEVETRNKEPVCDFEEILNDGFCDDEANTYNCDFDGGDCCKDPKNTQHCLQCRCLVTTIPTTVYTTTTTLFSTISIDRNPLGQVYFIL